MHWKSGISGVFISMLLAAPAHAAGGQDQPARPRPFIVQLAAGSHVRDAGNVQSVSVGYATSRDVTLLLNVERNHIPTTTEAGPRSFSATRGGTLTWVSGELRYTAPLDGRVAPFFMAGAGAGVSRPNVNDIFRDAVTNAARGAYAGGGLRIRLTPSLDAIVDGRALLMLERDSLMAMLPVRAGVTWRF